MPLRVLQLRIRESGSWLRKTTPKNRNEQTALTTLLLYRSGFYVGKYIFLESKIAGYQRTIPGTQCKLYQRALRKLVKAGELKRQDNIC